MYDANLAVASTVVSTATTTNSAAIPLRNPAPTAGINVGGTPKRGMFLRVRVTACTGAAQTVDFTVQHSDDGINFATLASPEASSYNVTFASPSMQLVNAAGVGILYIPVNTNKAYIRLTCVTTGATVAVTYRAELGVAER